MHDTSELHLLVLPDFQASSGQDPANLNPGRGHCRGKETKLGEDKEKIIKCLDCNLCGGSSKQIITL